MLCWLRERRSSKNERQPLRLPRRQCEMPKTTQSRLDKREVEEQKEQSDMSFGSFLLTPRSCVRLWTCCTTNLFLVLVLSFTVLFSITFGKDYPKWLLFSDHQACFDLLLFGGSWAKRVSANEWSGRSWEADQWPRGFVGIRTDRWCQWGIVNAHGDCLWLYVCVSGVWFQRNNGVHYCKSLKRSHRSWDRRWELGFFLTTFCQHLAASSLCQRSRSDKAAWQSCSDENNGQQSIGRRLRSWKENFRRVIYSFTEFHIIS